MSPRAHARIEKDRPIKDRLSAGGSLPFFPHITHNFSTLVENSVEKPLENCLFRWKSVRGVPCRGALLSYIIRFRLPLPPVGIVPSAGGGPCGKDTEASVFPKTGCGEDFPHPMWSPVQNPPETPFPVRPAQDRPAGAKSFPHPSTDARTLFHTDPDKAGSARRCASGTVFHSFRSP